MKIIDTTTYFEEKLMMNLRFNILNQYVDNFIVSEARFTHSGKKKDIYF
jgi:beta-1,4-mannosyl-glycoprotein beta-1,4-N-acetylglucosaminyltransferase